MQDTTSTSCSSARTALLAKRISLKRNQMYSSMQSVATITATTASLLISELTVAEILSVVIRDVIYIEVLNKCIIQCSHVLPEIKRTAS